MVTKVKDDDKITYVSEQQIDFSGMKVDRMFFQHLKKK
jgi:hypothetical protein